MRGDGLLISTPSGSTARLCWSFTHTDKGDNSSGSTHGSPLLVIHTHCQRKRFLGLHGTALVIHTHCHSSRQAKRDLKTSKKKRGLKVK